MDRPLLGKKILVTREKNQAQPFVEKLEEAGGQALLTPLLTFKQRNSQENQLLLQELHDFSWVFFTSANGVKFFFHHISQHRIERSLVDRLHFAVVGKKTAKSLQNYGYEADFQPKSFNGKDMVRKFLEKYSSKQRILLVCGNKSRQDIPNLLTEQQVFFRKIVLYDTLLDESSKHRLKQYIMEGSVDALTFTSPSTIDAFLKLTQEIASDVEWMKESCLCLCIGTTTEYKAKSEGFKRVQVPNEFTIDGMINKLTNYFTVKG